MLPGATTTTTEPPIVATTTTTTLPGATTTTTTLPATTPGESETPTGPGRATGTRPTEALALAGGVAGPPESSSDDSGFSGALRPLTRITAVAATAVETISNPSIAFAVLAAFVAWLSVKGLERAPGSRTLTMRVQRWRRRR